MRVAIRDADLPDGRCRARRRDGHGAEILLLSGGDGDAGGRFCERGQNGRVGDLSRSRRESTRSAAPEGPKGVRARNDVGNGKGSITAGLDPVLVGEVLGLRIQTIVGSQADPHVPSRRVGRTRVGDG